MRCRLAELVVGLALLAPVRTVQCEEPTDVAPPPGAPADVALWTRGQQVGEAVVASRAEAGRLQQRVKAERLADRLERAAAGEKAATAAALGTLRERLLARWQRDYEVAARPWPVDPTRVCWYPMLGFDSALRAPAVSGRGDLGQARAELTACVEKAEQALRAMDEANRALAEATAEATKALAAPGAEPVSMPGSGAGDR